MKRGRTKKNFSKNEKGVSPVIATVLLIAMVVVIGLIVFLWFRGIIQEEGTKFRKNVKLNCADVVFEASYSGGVLNIVNTGNVPIYRMKIRRFKEGNYDTQELSEGWKDSGLNQGETFSGSIDTTGIDKIIITPVLIASSGEGRKTYACEEQYGYEIVL